MDNMKKALEGLEKSFVFLSKELKKKIQEAEKNLKPEDAEKIRTAMKDVSFDKKIEEMNSARKDFDNYLKKM